MRLTLVFAIAFTLLITAFAWAGDAGPVLDAGVSIDAGNVVTALPSPDTPSDFIANVVDSVKGGNWRALAALGIVVLVWATRKFGAKYWDFLGTDKGGAALVLFAGILSQIAVVIFGHDPLSVKTIINGVVLGFTAAGGWVVVKKAFGK